MKKILLTVIMILMLVSPVMAKEVIVVDNAIKPMETMTIDNRLFVPLRSLAEAMGAEVTWNQAIFIKSVKRPEIVGDDKFKILITQALDLLKEKDPPDYETVCTYTKQIIFTPNNDEAYAHSEGSDKINICTSLLNRSNLSTEYIASVLVHEAVHLCNVRYYFSDIRQNENMAYLRGIATLQILGATQEEIIGTELTRQKVVK
jgi:hypothetical protein